MWVFFEGSLETEVRLGICWEEGDLESGACSVLEFKFRSGSLKWSLNPKNLVSQSPSAKRSSLVELE